VEKNIILSIKKAIRRWTDSFLNVFRFRLPTVAAAAATTVVSTTTAATATVIATLESTAAAATVVVTTLVATAATAASALVATATAAASALESTTAATPAWTFFSVVGFFYNNFFSIQFGFVNGSDCSSCFVIVGHFNKTKSF
jgi:hypothetical protein